MKILQFVIPKNSYSLCLVNPHKRDIFNLYIRYFGYSKERLIQLNYAPVMLMTDQLYGESYAILEECHNWEPETVFHYEILYVTNEGIVLQRFYRNELKNVRTNSSHPLFTSSVWEIEETDYELIDIEDIIQIVFKDIYAKEVPTNLSTYRSLIEKSELFEHFFEELYIEMRRFYNGDKCHSRDKWEFANMLQTKYHVQFIQSEGSDIILSNCSGLMNKLNLSKQQMAEYFMKYLD